MTDGNTSEYPRGAPRRGREPASDYPRGTREPASECPRARSILSQVAKLQHFAVHATAPPRELAGIVSDACGALWYGAANFAGAPSMTCIEFLHKHPYRPDPPINVSFDDLTASLRVACRAAGLVDIPCTCDLHDWKHGAHAARHAFLRVGGDASAILDPDGGVVTDTLSLVRGNML